MQKSILSENSNKLEWGGLCQRTFRDFENNTWVFTFAIPKCVTSDSNCICFVRHLLKCKCVDGALRGHNICSGFQGLGRWKIWVESSSWWRCLVSDNVFAKLTSLGSNARYWVPTMYWPRCRLSVSESLTSCSPAPISFHSWTRLFRRDLKASTRHTHYLTLREASLGRWKVTDSEDTRAL